MIVISDTSVITNLIQINRLELLPAIFEKIIIEQIVFDELIHIPSQKLVLKDEPWLHIERLQNTLFFQQFAQILDAGEAASIALALEKGADLLIIDERKGRQVALDHGIKITGLLGILLLAKSKGILQSVDFVLDELTSIAGFYVHANLRLEILKQAGESSPKI